MTEEEFKRQYPAVTGEVCKEPRTESIDEWRERLAAWHKSHRAECSRCEDTGKELPPDAFGGYRDGCWPDAYYSYDNDCPLCTSSRGPGLEGPRNGIDPRTGSSWLPKDI